MSHKCDGCRYKSEHQEMGFASMGVCTRTLNLVEAMNNYNAEKCPYKKTNFEKIKAMTVDEMAEILERSVDCENYCVFVDEDGVCIGRGNGCVMGVKKWLESEVEE